jgi:hypothetical protein
MAIQAIISLNNRFPMTDGTCGSDASVLGDGWQDPDTSAEAEEVAAGNPARAVATANRIFLLTAFLDIMKPYRAIAAATLLIVAGLCLDGTGPLVPLWYSGRAEHMRLSVRWMSNPVQKILRKLFVAGQTLSVVTAIFWACH